jgi:hypothetical protein
MATQSVQIRVDARIPWQATDIFVQEEDRLRIDVPNPGLPNVNHPKPWPWGPNCDPDGNRSDGVPPFMWEDAIAPNLIVFALVGRIGESGEPFFVGSSFDQSAPASGHLYLSYNDGVNFNDNSGYWDVLVTVEPSCPGGGCWNEDEAKCAYNYSGADAKTYASIAEYKGAYNPNSHFCVYRYPDSSVNPCGAPSGASDCANFVSQALLYGGLPLTNDWYAEDGIDTSQWAGAEDTSQLPSYLRWLVSGDPNDSSVDIRTNGQVWVNRVDTGRTIPNLNQTVDYESVDITERDNVIAVGEALWTEGIRIGDVLYAITDGLEHVALIVAWGPYVTTWNEIYNMNTAALPTERDSSNPVPYVIDHGNHVLNANPKPQVWAAGPKPYYALWWAPPNETSPGNFDERENADSAAQPPWGFIHIPSIVLFPPEQVREPWFDDKSEILA